MRRKWRSGTPSGLISLDALLKHTASVALLALAPALPVAALMAGVAPDSASARIDANVATSPFAGVAAISIGGSTFSGVVIAPQYILTAGHVAAAGNASAMQVTLNPGPTAWTSAVVAATTYPTFSFPYDDLGILQLATPVPAGVPVYSLYSGPLQTGLILSLAGYGASGNGNVGVSVGPAASVKRSGRNSLDVLTAAVDNSGLSSSFFEYDFDGPSGNGPLGGPTLGNAVETMVANGDSGGPAFVAVGASLQLLGINTFAATTVPNQPVTYTFGEIGGGIVAADPRFAAWLQATTQGTMPSSNASSNDSDGPLPAWADVLLAGALLFIGGKMRACPSPPS
jgi:hypothetical protein